MTALASISTNIFSIATLIVQICILVAAIILILAIFEHPNERLHHMSRKTAENAFLLGFIISFVALISSLFYSNVIGFTPCELCWWQRIFLYPQVILFGIAWYNEKVHKVEDDVVFLYSFIFSLIGGAIGVFQYYGQMFNPNALALCGIAGDSCARIFFISFGYITIPMMSLTAYAVLILLYFFRRHHIRKNKKI